MDSTRKERDKKHSSQNVTDMKKVTYYLYDEIKAKRNEIPVKVADAVHLHP